jgi:hypothetical protein
MPSLLPSFSSAERDAASSGHRKKQGTTPPDVVLPGLGSEPIPIPIPNRTRTALNSGSKDPDTLNRTPGAVQGSQNPKFSEQVRTCSNKFEPQIF